MSENYIQLPPDSTGKKARAIYRSDLGSYEEVQASKHIEEENPVYAVAVNASAVAASKHHLSIWNGSSSYIRILKVIVSMHITAAVTGFIMQYIMQRASAVSGGTALTIVKLDNRDPDPPSGISATTGATVTLKEAPIAIFALNPEETGGFNYTQFDPPKPIVVAPNEGITIQQYATAGVGLFNAVIYFSVEVIKP
jgi:uncharacterized membrane protein YwzB